MDKEFEDRMREFDKGFRDSESYKILTGRGYSASMLEILNWYL